jgi:hypothetical protein
MHLSTPHASISGQCSIANKCYYQSRQYNIILEFKLINDTICVVYKFDLVAEIVARPQVPDRL